jgi:hypothetical protein
MSNKKRLREMDRITGTKLEKAAEECVLYVEDGLSPSEAVAKAALDNDLNYKQAELLIYSYNGGMFAEKKASGETALGRLSEFEVADPFIVKKLMFGESKEKTSSFNLSVLGKDFSKKENTLFDTLFEKKAEKEEPKKKGICITSTTISIGFPKKIESEKDGGCLHAIPSSMEEMLEAGLKPLSSDLFMDIRKSLRKMMEGSKEAMYTKCGEADVQNELLHSLVDDLCKETKRPYDLKFKTAGLHSVRECYPEVAEIIGPFVGETLARQTKSAALDILSVTREHPWVIKAAAIKESLDKTAEATLDANEEIDRLSAINELYATDYSQPAAWRKLAGFLDSAKNVYGYGSDGVKHFREGQAYLGNVAGAGVHNFLNPDADPDAATHKKKDDFLKSINEPYALREIKDIEDYSMLNDLIANDEIIKAYPNEDVIEAYNEVRKSFPSIASSKLKTRTVLQSILSQGRFSIPEIETLSKIESPKEKKSALGNDGKFNTHRLFLNENTERNMPITAKNPVAATPEDEAAIVAVNNPKPKDVDTAKTDKHNNPVDKNTSGWLDAVTAVAGGAFGAKVVPSRISRTAPIKKLIADQNVIELAKYAKKDRVLQGFVNKLNAGPISPDQVRPDVLKGLARNRWGKTRRVSGAGLMALLLLATEQGLGSWLSRK